jgi:hypothetical protein
VSVEVRVSVNFSVYLETVVLVNVLGGARYVVIYVETSVLVSV